LNFEEFLERAKQSVYVSATPGSWELDRSHGIVTEQIIRPTGLVDPLVDVRPVNGQMDDLLAECRKRAKADERVLVTTLTKRMAEELTEYISARGVKARYLHSDIDTLERMAIIKELRSGVCDVLVGINLLREGLDLPEVSLVAVLDADKEGFLRSAGSLIQTFGRAARNVHGQVLLYDDVVTRSMRTDIGETERRRELQLAFNKEHDITPATVRKTLDSPLLALYESVESSPRSLASAPLSQAYAPESREKLGELIKQLEKEMREAAKELEFEQAAMLRDRMRHLQQQFLNLA
jgi:excinuclease ABC subunit B